MFAAHLKIATLLSIGLSLGCQEISTENHQDDDLEVSFEFQATFDSETGDLVFVAPEPPELDGLILEAKVLCIPGFGKFPEDSNPDDYTRFQEKEKDGGYQAHLVIDNLEGSSHESQQCQIRVEDQNGTVYSDQILSLSTPPPLGEEPDVEPEEEEKIPVAKEEVKSEKPAPIAKKELSPSKSLKRAPSAAAPIDKSTKAFAGLKN